MITQVRPERLHSYWDFVERGLREVRRRTREVRWIEPDVYAALQYKTATCYLVSERRKLLGFFIVHPRQIEFSDKTELFLWVAWSIPLREQTPEDNVRGHVIESLAFLEGLRFQGKHERVICLTAREGMTRSPLYKSHFRTQFRSLTLNAISRP